jgi:ribonucleoside-triphosphate reductase
LDEAVQTAVRVHVERRAFFSRLLGFRSVGPLSLLCFEHGGQPYLDIEEAVWRVGVTGLNECVQALLGEELHASARAAGLGRRLLEHLHRALEEAGEREHARFVLAAVDDDAVNRRFAALDLQVYPERAASVIKADSITHDPAYTGGVRLAAAPRLTLIERARCEGAFHELLGSDAVSTLPLRECDPAPESMAAFIEKVFCQTQVRRLAFTRGAGPN